MFCPKCGAKNEDGVKFCYQCGNQLSGTVENNQPAVQPTAPVYSQPQAAPYNPYQNPSYAQNSMNGQPVKTPVKSKKPVIFTLALLAVVIVACFLFFKNSSKGGVLDNILSAANQTVEAGSFEFTMKTSEEDDEDSYDSKAEGVIVYDMDKEKLDFDVEADDEHVVLYDGIMYNEEDGEVYSDDASDDLDLIFKYYKEYKDGLKGLSKVDWKDAIEEANLDSYIDSDKLDKCMDKFIKNMNSKDYYKKVCNDFSVKKSGNGTTYSFDVDVPKFVESVLDTFKPAIDYDIDEVKDEILDNVDTFDKLLINVTIKSGKLANIEVICNMDDDYNTKDTLELELSNYGKASIDKSMVDDLISKAGDSDY